MARSSKPPVAKQQQGSLTIRKLRSALKHIAETSPRRSFEEGERYICSVCDLPLKLCLADPSKECAAMILEGTELQALRRAAKELLSRCLRCGSALPKSLLRKNPLAELCPSCQSSSRKSKSPKRSKGVTS